MSDQVPKRKHLSLKEAREVSLKILAQQEERWRKYLLKEGKDLMDGKSGPPGIMVEGNI